MDLEESVLYDEGVDSGSSEDEFMDNDFQLDNETTNYHLQVKEPEKNSFKVLSTEEIVQDMVDCIKEVNLIVQMPVTITRILLNHFKWDKQKLTEKMYDTDQENFFKEANIANPYIVNTENSLKDSVEDSSDNIEDCEVCYTSLPRSKMTGLQCGHRFCKDCWNEYLKNKIMDEGDVQTILCAAHDCNNIVDDVSVVNLVKDRVVQLRYQHLITNIFVDCNRLLRWCPAPGCSNAVKAKSAEMQPVTCKCGKTFCFACGNNWHDPINCQLLHKWLKKHMDESETSNWVVVNTKDCPDCNASIEKNGGCNYVRCQKCLHQFCWVCMNPWSAHPSAWNQCNKYVETDRDREAKTQKEKYEAALKRYLFYSNRYMNHAKSLGFEDQLTININQKMEEMQLHASWIEVQFLKKAVEVLHECRQTLMYTYAFAFYLKKSNHTEIFEENQRDLEFSTETLSGHLEHDIGVDNLVDIKQKVQDRYKYCEGRRKVLLEHVHEGNEKDIWEYLDL